MKIRNAKRWARPGAEPYLISLLGFFLAFAARMALQPWLGSHVPMLTFAINCIVVAFFYGFWPSFIILLLSLPAALYFFVEPFYSFGIVATGDIVILVVYSTLVTICAVLFEWVRREQYKAELHARVSDSRYRLLVEADEDRRTILKKVLT